MKILSAADSFFLYAETEQQHQHTLGLVILDPSTAPNPDKVTPRALAKKLNRDIDALPVFRQRLANIPIALAPPVMIDDPDFNFEEHIDFVTLRTSEPMRELCGVMSRFASEALDKKRPLWRSLFIEGLPDNKLAICTKCHHLISDGVTGAEFMAQQFDTEPLPLKAQDSNPGKWQAERQSPYKILRSSWQKRQQERPRIGDMLGKTVKSLQSRRNYFQSEDSKEGLVTPLIPAASKCKFNGPITQNRMIAIGTLPMKTLKEIKTHYHTTLNDVILTACALSMREYLIQTDDLPGENLVCAVPVSLRSSNSDADSGNAVSNMFVTLPVHQEDPVKCLRSVHEHTAASKKLFDQSFENLIMGYVGMLTPALANAAMKSMFSNRVADSMAPQSNLVVSNFPGPRSALYMVGAKLLATYPIGPIMTGSGLNFTFMSQEDQMNFSVQTCRENLPEAWELVDGVTRAIDRLANSIPKPARAKRKTGRRKA